MDFVSPGVPSSGPGGERVVSTPIVRYDRVIFTTMTPTSDPCVPGGSSWLMELDMLTGARTVQSVFDFNGDGAYTVLDQLANGRSVSGVRSTVGIARTPAWLENGNSSEVAVKQISGSSGGIMSLINRKPVTNGTIRRIFWQQLR